MVCLGSLHAWCNRTGDIILYCPDVNRSSPCWSWCWLSVNGMFQSRCSIFILLFKISWPTDSLDCPLVHRRNLPSSIPRPNDLICGILRGRPRLCPLASERIPAYGSPRHGHYDDQHLQLGANIVVSSTFLSMMKGISPSGTFGFYAALCSWGGCLCCSVFLRRRI
jgi:hypothetical protein